MPQLYDTKILMETHQGDKEFVKYIISLFVKHIPEVRADLNKACDAKEWYNVFLCAHKLKASIDLFNIKDLTGLIREVEQKAKKNIHTETIAGDIQRISIIIDDCIASMKQEYKIEA